MSDQPNMHASFSRPICMSQQF